VGSGKPGDDTASRARAQVGRAFVPANVGPDFGACSLDKHGFKTPFSPLHGHSEDAAAVIRHHPSTKAVPKKTGEATGAPMALLAARGPENAATAWRAGAPK